MSLADGCAWEREFGVPTPPEPEVTLADVDKAIAAIPPPQTYEDYGKVYLVLPGGGYRQIKPGDAEYPK